MIPALREAFNQNYRPETYQRFLKELEVAAGTGIAFRVSETPCFLPKTLLDQMVAYGRELVLQLMDNPEYLRAADVTVPSQYNVANEAPRPMFLQVDFGLVRDPPPRQEPWRPGWSNCRRSPPCMDTSRCWLNNISIHLP